MKRQLNFYVIGKQDFHNCLILQKKTHQRCYEKKLDPTVLIVEHDPVITLGKNSKLTHILTHEKTLKQQQIPIHTCNRGGEVTAHMPGQLILYPILPLSLFDFSV